MPDAEPPPGVDVTRPSPARLYDYYLGGTSNFAVDRQAAEQIRAKMPELADDPWGLVARYMKAMAPGSYLALSHVTYDKLPSQLARAGAEVYARATSDIYLRSAPEIERFFGGLELVPAHPGAEPGLAYVGAWGADVPDQADSDGSRYFYCGVARRP